MTNIEQKFGELWEREQSGKQIPAMKLEEQRKVALEWFVRGVQYLTDIIDEMGFLK